jgi:hypothetical protein
VILDRGKGGGELSRGEDGEVEEHGGERPVRRRVSGRGGGGEQTVLPEHRAGLLELRPADPLDPRAEASVVERAVKLRLDARAEEPPPELGEHFAAGQVPQFVRLRLRQQHDGLGPGRFGRPAKLREGHDRPERRDGDHVRRLTRRRAAQ